MRLAALLLVLVPLVGMAAAQEAGMTLRPYDVSVMTSPRNAHEGPLLGPGSSWGREGTDPPRPTPFLSLDALADFIRDTISPQVWDEGGDVQGRQGGILLVKAPADVHRKVEALIAEISTAAARRVTFTVEVFDLPAAAYPRLTPAALEVPEGQLLESASGETYPGVRTSVKVTNRVRYMRDYDVEIAQGSMISDPIVEAAEEGFVVDLIPHPTLDGSRIVVEALLQHGWFQTPFRKVDLAIDEEYFAEPFRSEKRSGNGVLELPTFNHVRTFSTAVLAPGGKFVIPILDRDRLKLFVVKADLPSRAGPGWIMDVGALTHHPSNYYFGFPRGAESVDLPLMVPEIRMDQGPGPRIGGPDEFVDAITQSVDPESWDDGKATLNVVGNSRLVLGASDEMESRIQRFLRGWEEKLLIPVDLDLRVYSMKSRLEPGAQSEVDLSGGKLLYGGAVSTLTGRRACVMAGNTMNFIADYDAEVAQEARISDPVIGQSFEGLVANLTPRLSPNREKLRLEIELLLAHRSLGKPLDTKTQYLGPVDHLSEKRTVMNTSVEFPAGGFYVLDAGPDLENPDRRLAIVIGARVR